MSLQFVLPKPQHLFIGRNFRQQPAKLGRLLGSRSTVLIRHGLVVRVVPRKAQKAAHLSNDLPNSAEAARAGDQVKEIAGRCTSG